jgi:hypothetical protein
MRSGQVVKCPICGRPYRIYSHYAGDQSACSGCRAMADRAVMRPDTDEEGQRRERFFGMTMEKKLAANLTAKQLEELRRMLRVHHAIIPTFLEEAIASIQFAEAEASVSLDRGSTETRVIEDAPPAQEANHVRSYPKTGEPPEVKG